MGAQKKCQLLISTIIVFLFFLFVSFLFLDEYVISEKSKENRKRDNGIFFSFIIIIISLIIWLYLLYSTFKQDIKIILISKKKRTKSDVNNINNDFNNFIKRAEYKFSMTRIRRRSFFEHRKVKKKITCIKILENNKILLGFFEGTIMLCSINKNYELKQIFSFNKYKEKKIVNICESLKYKNEFMISVKMNFRPLKLMKFNVDYKYSLIKVLARDKAYLVLKEFGNTKWKNIFKILSFQNGQFLIADRKGIYIKEKINIFNYDDSEYNNNEYQISQEYLLNNESNEEIYDILKTDEESFVTLETKNNFPNLHFYKLNNIQKDQDFIENIIESRSLTNRLCYINHSLIAVQDNNQILIINFRSKQKVKTIKLDNIQKSGIDSDNEGNIIFIKNIFINGYNIPHIVKMNIINQKENNLYGITNILQDYQNEDEKRELIGSKIKLVRCLKNKEGLIFGNSSGKLFIWEEINNSSREIFIFNNSIIK